MIEIIGPKDREEFRYASQLAEALVEFWPDLEESEDRVQIAASAKVYGGRVQDIDVIVLAQLHGRRFRPGRPVRVENPDGEMGLHAGEIAIRNLLLTIEVKSHPQQSVRFDGLNVVVRYREGEKSATDQAMDQMNALRGYIRKMSSIQPFAVHLVALENVSSEALPARPHNIIGANQSIASLLTQLCELKAPWQGSSKFPTLSCCNDEVAEIVSRLPIFTPLQPTALDRKRMERLSAASTQLRGIESKVGSRQVILRGHGGAGKTSILLQLAKRAYDDKAERSLILTYNQALTADIRRLMALAAVPTSDDEGGIRVETVMTFVHRACRRLGIIEDGDDPLNDYAQRTEELGTLLKNEVITPADIKTLITKYPEEMRFDHIMIDEGQDWPRVEIDILRSLYGPHRLVVADGIDQFVRGSVADWRAGVNASDTERLRLSLRMKAGLSRFANAMADELGAPGWKVQPSLEALGGRVIVVEGAFENEIELHNEMIRDLRSAGNSPIDCLYCVPPSMVSTSAAGLRQSRIQQTLMTNGLACWDGAAGDIRRDIPRDIEAARVVQYQSCRGLEGWTVIAVGLDEFYDRQRETFPTNGVDHPSRTAEQALVHAARWVMIPLSRAMDTLVVNISSATSPLGLILKKVAARMPDLVEWRN